MEVSTINLLTVIRSHLKFISRLKTWRHSYWSGILSDFQILGERSDGRAVSERRLGRGEKSLHGQRDTLPSGAETGGFPFFTKCNRFTDLTFCCFIVTVDVRGSTCSANSCLKYHFKLE